MALCAAALAVSGCASIDGTALRGPLAHPVSLPVASGASSADDTPEVVQVLEGEASWYGRKFQGRLTASGERFDMNGLTAAHRSLPFGTRVRVVNETNGRSVVVTVNDRGPYIGKRIIDLSRKAAEAIGLRSRGVAVVRLEVLDDG